MILRANALRLPLRDESVHMCCTSVPYFGLRTYEGVPETAWPAMAYAPMPGLPACVEVPAMTCCLGNEPTLEAYVGHMLLPFREVWRALRPDGTFWLNCGESHAGGGGYSPDAPSNQAGSSSARGAGRGGSKTTSALSHLPSGLKPTDLCMVPVRLALALQADGWYLRSMIPWLKLGTCMPESVTSRPASATEYVFLMARSQSYFFDSEATRLQGAIAAGTVAAWGSMERREAKGVNSRPPEGWQYTGTRNRRNTDWFLDSVKAIAAKGFSGLLEDEGGNSLAFVVNPKGFAGSHFAVWPEALVEPMIRAGTSDAGCCQACSAPYVRQVDAQPMVCRRSERAAIVGRTQTSGTMVSPPVHTTTGWAPSCACSAGPPVPCVVLDCFAGSGTTLRVARQLGRQAVGTELSEEYCPMARQREGTYWRKESAPARQPEAELQPALF